MTKFWVKAVGCFAVVLCSVPLLRAGRTDSTAAANESQVFKSNVRLVLVDVVATDDKGEPVTGLSQSDFTLIEDGKEQRIRSSEPHLSPATSKAGTHEPVATLPPDAQLPPGMFTNAPLLKTSGPVNVILFDVLNTSPQSAAGAKEQMLKFLEHLPSGQPVALFVLGSRLRLIQSPTGNTDALVVAAKKLTYEKTPLRSSPRELQQRINEIDTAARQAAAGGGTADTQLANHLVQALKDETTNLLRHRVQYTMTALENLAHALSAYPGRKNVIWLTESFPMSVGPDSLMTAAGAGTRSEDPTRNADNFLDTVHKLGTILANLQIAIYPIDVGGLRTSNRDASVNAMETGVDFGHATALQTAPFPGQFADEESNRATMLNVASDTGGRAFFRTNDIALAAQKTMEAGSNYYTLAYTPANSDWRGRYRHIEVKVSKAHVKLEYRRGYYAYPEPGPVSTVESRRLLATAMQLDKAPYTSVLFQAWIVPDPQDPSHIMIKYAIDPRTVTFQDRADGRKSLALDFLAIAINDAQRDAGHASDSLEPAISAEAYQSVMQAAVPASQELRLKSGHYSVRLGVIDRHTQKIGTLDASIAVP